MVDNTKQNDASHLDHSADGFLSLWAKEEGFTDKTLATVVWEWFQDKFICIRWHLEILALNKKFELDRAWDPGL